ncbi:microsomal signal peptidase 12 kDa subunit-domain-containing protein [Mycena epipterygia]|nr:microsomal signal peptidase 12 kDa subunit-domain-containing protein [Mycena epipterygia]
MPNQQVQTEVNRRATLHPNTATTSSPVISSFIQQISEGKIDFADQQRVEQAVRIWLIGSAVIYFVLGFALQSLQLAFATFGVSVLALLVVPPWPMFNRHPTQWFPVVPKVDKE